MESWFSGCSWDWLNIFTVAFRFVVFAIVVLATVIVVVVCWAVIIAEAPAPVGAPPVALAFIGAPALVSAFDVGPLVD